MSALPLLVLLQAGEGEGSPFSMLVPMALIFMIFYFLLIRPQQKRQKQQEELLKSIEKGDQVVTSGDLHNCGIVADTQAHVATLRAWRRKEPLDNLELSQRHRRDNSADNIRERLRHRCAKHDNHRAVADAGRRRLAPFSAAALSSAAQPPPCCRATS